MASERECHVCKGFDPQCPDCYELQNAPEEEAEAALHRKHFQLAEAGWMFDLSEVDDHGSKAWFIRHPDGREFGDCYGTLTEAAQAASRHQEEGGE